MSRLQHVGEAWKGTRPASSPGGIVESYLTCQLRLQQVFPVADGAPPPPARAVAAAAAAAVAVGSGGGEAVPRKWATCSPSSPTQ